MCGLKLVAEQIWVLVEARPHLLAETLRRKVVHTGKYLTLPRETSFLDYRIRNSSASQWVLVTLMY